MRGDDGEVLLAQRGAVDAGESWGERPGAVGQAQAVEPLARGVVHALAEVLEVTGLGLQDAQVVFGLALGRVGDARAGRGQQAIVGAFDVAHRALVQLDHAADPDQGCPARWSRRPAGSGIR